MSSGAAVEIADSPLTRGVTMKGVLFRSVRPVDGGRTAVAVDGKPVIVYTEGAAALGFDLHNSNLPLKYDFPVLIQNMLDWLLPAEEETDGNVEKPVPLGESDVRTVAPEDISAEISGRSEQGRELTGILLAVFLILLLAETGVSRYVG